MLTVYPKNFEVAGHYCLLPKGLMLDIWADSIEDGRKGDFVVLYGLNLMLDTHTLMHLQNNRLWMTCKDQSLNHDGLLKICTFHLVYLGRGLFVELTERKRPLIVAKESEDRKSIVIGELTFDEEDTLNKVIYRGLGIGVDNTGDEPQLHSNEKLITIKEEEIEDVPAISFKKKSST